MQRLCKTCGTVCNKVFCSDTCRIAWRAAHKLIPGTKIAKTCVICGKEFTTLYSRAKYCSNECGQKANRKYGQEYRIAHRIAHSDENSRQLRFSILARDGFRCRYCGRSAQEDGVKLEVDHIVPKSRGGSDDSSNLITACSNCNGGKGDLLLLVKGGQIPSYLTIESS